MLKISPFQDMNFPKFEYHSKISRERSRILDEAHYYAYIHAKGCDNLGVDAKRNLKKLYSGKICHGVTNRRNVFANSKIGKKYIRVNLGLLFILKTEAIAQVLVHEIMHCAGYRHRKKMKTDKCGRGGMYYESVPLKAQACVGRCIPELECREISGQCSLGIFGPI